jgi:hypothetical protein
MGKWLHIAQLLLPVLFFIFFISKCNTAELNLHVGRWLLHPHKYRLVDDIHVIIFAISEVTAK